MIRLLFSIRYQSQLRRVRPQVMTALEAAVVRSLRESGGVITVDGSVLKAGFDESKVAFWLDLIVALEGIAAAIAEASKELFGFACLVHADVTEPRPSMLREFSRLGGPTGIWCDERVSAALAPYAEFGDSVQLTMGAAGDREEEYRPLSSFLLARPSSPSDSSEEETRLTEKFQSLLTADGEGRGTCTVLVREGSRDMKRALLAAIRSRLESFPPFIVRFGVGGTGLACLADAVVSEASSLATVVDRKLRSEIEAPDGLLSAVTADRLRAEPPEALAEEFGRFLSAFTSAYVAGARARTVPPIFLLHDIQNADPLALKIVSDALSRQVETGAMVILTMPKPVSLEAWRGPTLRYLQVEESAQGGQDAFPARQSDDINEYLYALLLLCPLFSPRELLPLFSLEGKPARSLEHALITLCEAGFIESPEDPTPARPGYTAIVEARLGEKAERVRTFVRRRLLAAVATGRARPSFGLLSALSALGGECDDGLALDAVEAEAGDGTISGLDRVFASSRMKAVLGKRVAPLAYIARARCVLRWADESSVRQNFAAPTPEWFPSPRYQGSALTDIAAFSLGVADIPNAEARAKEAILLLQGLSDSHGLARAYRLLGLVELAKERVSEAIDYLSFAQESSENTAEHEEAALDAAYSSSAEFIWGNTAKAERLALVAETLSAKAYRTDWAHWARFFRGRLRFEAGCYRDAAELFDSLLTSEDEATEDERRIAGAWSFRARLYGAVPQYPQPPAEDGDGGLFLLESLFFSKDYSGSIALADKMLAASVGSQDRRFRSPERPDWSSGFSQAEDIVLPTGMVRRRLVRMLRSLSVSALGRASSSALDAVEELRTLVKDENLTEADPYDALYYRAYCQALEAASAPTVDVGTALSVAFQRVQRRASRIDDVGAKRSYLYINRWNAALLAEAKTHNLI